MRRMASGASRLHSILARRAMVLCGGDKSGGSQRRFYRQLIDKADARFDAHLAALRRATVKDRAKGRKP